MDQGDREALRVGGGSRASATVGTPTLAPKRGRCSTRGAKRSFGRRFLRGRRRVGDVERAEGGALDRREDRDGEGACSARLGVPEEGEHEPAGSEALKRPGPTPPSGRLSKKAPGEAG